MLVTVLSLVTMADRTSEEGRDIVSNPTDFRGAPRALSSTHGLTAAAQPFSLVVEQWRNAASGVANSLETRRAEIYQASQRIADAIAFNRLSSTSRTYYVRALVAFRREGKKLRREQVDVWFTVLESSHAHSAILYQRITVAGKYPCLRIFDAAIFTISVAVRLGQVWGPG